MDTSRPELAFGERFKVRSNAGRYHVLTFLDWPLGADAGYVRLDNNEIARLNDNRVEWASCRAGSGALGQALVSGDAILVDTKVGSSRGWLIQLGTEIKMRAKGSVTRVHVDEVEGLFLLFRARSLKRGDAFVAETKTGGPLRGRVRDVSPTRVAMVDMADGSRTALPLETLAIDSLHVLIPVPVGELIDTRGDLETETACITPRRRDEPSDEVTRADFFLWCNPLDPVELELGKPLVVGRSPRLSTLVLPNTGVSRKHAEFVRRPDGLHVRDLGSLNGTWIDGRQVGESFVRIEASDTVRIEVFHLSIRASD